MIKSVANRTRKHLKSLNLFLFVFNPPTGAQFPRTLIGMLATNVAHDSFLFCFFLQEIENYFYQSKATKNLIKLKLDFLMIVLFEITQFSTSQNFFFFFFKG